MTRANKIIRSPEREPVHRYNWHLLKIYQIKSYTFKCPYIRTIICIHDYINISKNISKYVPVQKISVT